MDVVDPEKRSRMMSGIKGKDTRPEMIVRRALHQAGLRYRLHAKELPGKPDMVFPKYEAVILVNGCFWHGHNCHLFKWPKTREEFWKEKINKNRERDARTLCLLSGSGWRVLQIWECALKGKSRLTTERIVHHCSEWLNSKTTHASLSFKDLEGYKNGTGITGN